jgi:pimeloyl-ACP methyl ester carboxylesterase
MQALNFLPNAVHQLTEPASVNLVQQIQRCAIATPLHTQPIDTAFVHQTGEGIPILGLHGFDSSLLEFRFLLPLLKNQTTWLVDLLGNGFTTRPEAVACTPTNIKTHLYQFWKTQIDQPVILLGASMGGAVAIDFTLSHPEAVAKLILIDSVGYTGPPPYIKFLFPPLDYLAVQYLRQRKLKALEFSAATNADPYLLDLIRCSVIHADMPGWHGSMISFTKSGGYGFLSDRIREVSQQTLILWGESDDILGTEDATKFHRDIAGSQLIWIQNSKHVPHIEQPQVTAKHILDFCAENHSH